MRSDVFNTKNEMSEDASIQFYSKNAAQYANETRALKMDEIYPHFLQYVPSEGKILDAGCGSGRDSFNFKQLGYEVTAFDASEEMCREAEKYLLQPVQKMCFEQLTHDSVFDGIWASASLVHTPWNKQSGVLRRLLRGLKPGGVLYASWKYGNGCHTEGIRSFCDMDETRVAEVLTKLECAKLLDQWTSFGSQNTSQKWLNVILEKG